MSDTTQTDNPTHPPETDGAPGTVDGATPQNFPEAANETVVGVVKLPSRFDDLFLPTSIDL